MCEPAPKPRRQPLQIQGLTGLSRSAARFLEQHPGRAELAVKVALEAAASQLGNLPDHLPEGLRPFLVQRSREDDMIGVSQAATRLKVSRTTVYDWADKGILLAWRMTKRGLTIPAEQILGEGRVTRGINQVAEMIGDPELAWEFLSAEAPFADQMARPIDLLKDGRIDDVLGAAAAYGTATT